MIAGRGELTLKITRQGSEFNTIKSVTLRRETRSVQTLLESKKFQRSGHKLLYDSNVRATSFSWIQFLYFYIVNMYYLYNINIANEAN